ncbi:MAG: PspC domain-containing protein [Epulopiscium sp.]|jgi:phage shock protein C|nr:PspC domain-containing protein [Candidatus Epulonipiscium sp.]
MQKKLYKSRTDRKISGVCGGLAQYFNMDSTLIRILWILFVLFGGSGVLAYVICALIIPDEPYEDYYYNNGNPN